MNRTAIRVVKVGGSLLDMPDLADRLQHWLASQSPAHHVLIAGGGALVEQVRNYHAQTPLSEGAAHWMCIDLMTVTAHLLHDRLPEIPLIEDDRLLCQRVGDRACTIFGVAPWMRQNEPHLPGTRLRISWDVTSDSIAGRLAIVLGADELVLLKSSLGELKDVQGISQLAATGFVDRMLPQLVADLQAIRLVNLREKPENWREIFVG